MRSPGADERRGAREAHGKPYFPPHLFGDIDRELELIGQQVAFLGGSETALRRFRELIERREFARLFLQSPRLLRRSRAFFSHPANKDGPDGVVELRIPVQTIPELRADIETLAMMIARASGEKAITELSRQAAEAQLEIFRIRKVRRAMHSTDASWEDLATDWPS